MSDLHSDSPSGALEMSAAQRGRILIRVRALLRTSRVMQLITAATAAGLAATLVIAHGGGMIPAIIAVCFAVGPIIGMAIRRSDKRRERQPWRWTPMAVGVALSQGIGLTVLLAGSSETRIVGYVGVTALLPALAVALAFAAWRSIERLPIREQCHLPVDLRFKLRRNEPVPEFAPDARWLSSARSVLTTDALVVQVSRGATTGAQQSLPINMIDKIEVREPRLADGPWLLFEDGLGLDVLWDDEILALTFSTGSVSVVPAFDLPQLAAALEVRRAAIVDRSCERDG